MFSTSPPPPLSDDDKSQYTKCLEGYQWKGFWKGSDKVLTVSASPVGSDLALGAMLYGDDILFPSALLQINWALQFLLAEAT